jgi:hypothetical protein
MTTGNRLLIALCFFIAAFPHNVSTQQKKPTTKPTVANTNQAVLTGPEHVTVDSLAIPLS